MSLNARVIPWHSPLALAGVLPPDDDQVRLPLPDVLWEQARIPAALDAWNAMLRQDPAQQPEIRLRITQAAIAGLQWGEAIRELSLCLPLRPKDASIPAMLAACYRNSGQWEPAAICAAQALQLDPTNRLAAAVASLCAAPPPAPPVADGLLCWPEEPVVSPATTSDSVGDPIFTEAVRLLECGATTQAEQLLEQVILLDPRHWEALFELGHLAETQNRLQWACHFYKRAKDCGSRAWEPHYNLARLLVEAGDLEPARPLLERALLLEPDSADAASLLASVLHRSGDPEEASFWLARAARLAPDRAEVWEQLAHLAMQDGRFDDAARWFAKAAGSDRDASVLFNLGLCCWKLGRWEDAAEAWSAGAGAGDTHAVHALAALAVSLGRWQVCDAALEEADHPLLRFAAAQARVRAGDREGAMAEYRACLAMQPTDAEAWLNLGLLHSDAGDSQAALEAWQQALQHDPSLAADYFG